MAGIVASEANGVPCAAEDAGDVVNVVELAVSWEGRTRDPAF